MNQWWSWILTAVGVTGLFLADSNRKAGWALGLGAQLLWVSYAVATEQWGFIASAFAYGGVYARNWLRWRRAAPPVPFSPEETPGARSGERLP